MRIRQIISNDSTPLLTPPEWLGKTLGKNGFPDSLERAIKRYTVLDSTTTAAESVYYRPGRGPLISYRDK